MASLSLDKELCSTCFLKISKNQKSIKCLTRGGRFHTRVLCIKLAVTCHQRKLIYAIFAASYPGALLKLGTLQCFYIDQWLS